MILLYHNIIEDSYPLDRWSVGQGLPLRCLERQLDWLRRHRRIVSLQEYLAMTEYGTVPVRKVVAITFDDGLASTFRRVYPLLERWSVPATFFISTSHLGQGGPLWFTYLNALCFESSYDEIEVRGRTFPLKSIEQRKRARRSLGALAHASGNPRAFSEELAASYQLPDSITAEYKGMSVEQLSFLGKCDLLEAGAHTVNHPFLDQLSEDEQEEEIVRSQQRLAELIGKRVRYFAYPSGDYNRHTLRLLGVAGFDAAFATHRKRLGTNDRFEIVRVGIYSVSFSKFWLKAQGAVTAARRLGLGAP